ncbi:hypothetical protein, partial [Paenibacillus sp. P3E]|uniref:hypothetical protein n=1 Tax=Paenibacillus sp. P3E TaxID=1349435 RepID=UPI001C4A1A25
MDKDGVMRSVLRNRVKFFGIVIFLCALNFLWFRNIEFKSLMGDDLRSWNFFQGKGFYDAVLMNFSGNKYRPVFNLVQFTLFAIFNADYQAYVNVNMIFNCVVIFFVFLVLL